MVVNTKWSFLRGGGGGGGLRPIILGKKDFDLGVGGEGQDTSSKKILSPKSKFLFGVLNQKSAIISICIDSERLRKIYGKM